MPAKMKKEDRTSTEESERGEMKVLKVTEAGTSSEKERLPPQKVGAVPSLDPIHGFQAIDKLIVIDLIMFDIHLSYRHQALLEFLLSTHLFSDHIRIT